MEFQHAGITDLDRILPALFTSDYKQTNSSKLSLMKADPENSPQYLVMSGFFNECCLFVVSI